VYKCGKCYSNKEICDESILLDIDKQHRNENREYLVEIKRLKKEYENIIKENNFNTP
jgi:methionyl-tRNA synthetase